MPILNKYFDVQICNYWDVDNIKVTFIRQLKYICLLINLKLYFKNKILLNLKNLILIIFFL